jgi:predicted metal-dependent HD superfamily phosphohydrolase
MNGLDPQRWDTLWQSVARQGDRSEWFNTLAKLYAEPHRYYHTAHHISECLTEFDAARHLATQPLAVELGLWFHDAIYDTHASDNEEQSALLAQQCLNDAGANIDLQAAVRELVLVTKAHNDSPHPDAPLLVDIDLSVLGAPPDRFFEYEDQIRNEYAWVPEELFRTKRAEILERFLSRAVIFRTPWFFDSREKQARANLRESIKRLGVR